MSVRRLRPPPAPPRASSPRRSPPGSRRRAGTRPRAGPGASPGSGRSCPGSRAARSRSSGSPAPSAGELAHQAVDLGLGPHVDAARRLVEDEHARPGRQPLGRAPPSAGCRPRACRRPARCRGVRIANRVDAVSREPRRSARRSTKPAAREPAAGWAARCSRAIVIGQHQALLLAVLGHIGRYRARIASAACRDADGLAVAGGSRPASGGSVPKIARASSVRPAPTSPAMPEDLARAQLERDRSSRAAGRAQPADLQHRRARLGLAPWGTAASSVRPTIMRISSSSAVVADVPRRRRSAPSRSTVTRSAELEDLVQAVRDVDDRRRRAPSAAGRSSNSRSTSCSVSAAVGSSMISDARVHATAPWRSRPSAAGRRPRAGHRRRRDRGLDVERRQERARLAAHRRPVDGAEALRGAWPEEDVLGHASGPGRG